MKCIKFVFYLSLFPYDVWYFLDGKKKIILCAGFWCIFSKTSSFTKVILLNVTGPTMKRTHIGQRRGNAMNRIPVLFLCGAHIFRNHPVNADRDALVALIDRLDSDVIELRNTIEASIANRCDSIRGCYRSSYDECRSLFDSGTQSCPSKEQLGYAVPECGEGLNCNGIFDYGATTVRLPAALANGPNGNPTNPFVSLFSYLRSASSPDLRFPDLRLSSLCSLKRISLACDGKK